MTTLPHPILIAAKSITRLSPIGGRGARRPTSGVSHQPTLRLSTRLRESLPIPCGPALRALRRGAVFDARFQKRVGLPQLSFADPLARKYMMGDDGEFAKRVSRDGSPAAADGRGNGCTTSDFEDGMQARNESEFLRRHSECADCRRAVPMSTAIWLHLPRPDLIQSAIS